MKSIDAVLLLTLLAPATSRAQEMAPGMQMGAPKDSQNTADKQQGAPAPCVETMPGMQMCPKAPAASGGMGQMPAMQMGGGMKELMDQMKPATFLQQIQHHASSGTTAEPNSTPTPMLMTMKGRWMLMFHANAFVTDTQQSSAQTQERGGDKLYSTNWFMPMAERRLGPGQLTVRTMFSLEPATVSQRQYPLLFQQGETAFGKPIADGQHPHDFFMELAALYDTKLGEKTLLSFYGAPIGDPSIGPHRVSTSRLCVGGPGRQSRSSPGRFNPHRQRRSHSRPDAWHRADRGERIPWPGAERVSLEHRPGQDRFVVDSADATAAAELERAVLLRTDRQPGVTLPE